jgi:hypothetical protein
MFSCFTFMFQGVPGLVFAILGIASFGDCDLLPIFLLVTGLLSILNFLAAGYFYYRISMDTEKKEATASRGVKILCYDRTFREKGEQGAGDRRRGNLECVEFSVLVVLLTSYDLRFLVLQRVFAYFSSSLFRATSLSPSSASCGCPRRGWIVEWRARSRWLRSFSTTPSSLLVASWPAARRCARA